MLNWILLIEKIKKSKKIMGVYWNLLKKAIKLTTRNSNGPQKKGFYLNTRRRARRLQFKYILG